MMGLHEGLDCPPGKSIFLYQNKQQNKIVLVVMLFAKTCGPRAGEFLSKLTHLVMAYIKRVLCCSLF